MYSSLCLPAKVYLIIAITGMLASLYNKISVLNLVFSAIFILLWTNILNWFCSRGYMFLSWFLVMLPLISAFVLLGIYITQIRKG